MKLEQLKDLVHELIQDSESILDRDFVEVPIFLGTLHYIFRNDVSEEQIKIWVRDAREAKKNFGKSKK